MPVKAGPLAPAARPAALGPVVVAVMDGVGLGPAGEGNAVAHAHTPLLDSMARWPVHGALKAHGLAVGLATDDDMGNSEVGHNALGAGQIVRQGAGRVADAVADGSLTAGASWQALLDGLRASGGALHLLGLVSDGNVHSHIDHLLALVRAAARDGLPRVYVHALLDGRDVSRQSALDYVDRLEAALGAAREATGGDFRIASGGGRMRITMDRYGADWPMVAAGYRAHVHGVGPACTSARQAIVRARAAAPEIGDQDLPAFVVHDAHGPIGRIDDGDAVVAFNFRGDRMLEITQAFEADSFAAFERHHEGRARPRVAYFGMTQYDGDQQVPARYLVAPPHIRNTLGERLAASAMAQLAVSETQKFGHVTYFWNGNRSGAFDPARERYVEVPSLTVPFAEQPAMQAEAIVDATVAALRERPFDLVRLNFPNGDMIGHTGEFAPTVRAVEAVDRALARLAKEVVAGLGGALVVTADHGNAEDMLERGADGAWQGKTSHSKNPVPFGILLPARLAKALEPSEALVTGTGGLANVAASLCVLLGRTPDPAWQPALCAWRHEERA